MCLREHNFFESDEEGERRCVRATPTHECTYTAAADTHTLDAAFAESPVGNAAYLAMADSALAVVREAVRDAYREGAIDAVNVNAQVNSFTGAQFAEMAYDESARWDISDSNAKWSGK